MAGGHGGGVLHVGGREGGFVSVKRLPAVEVGVGGRTGITLRENAGRVSGADGSAKLCVKGAVNGCKNKKRQEQYRPYTRGK